MICSQCKKKFTPTHSRQKYCSQECAKIKKIERQKKYSRSDKAREAQKKYRATQDAKIVQAKFRLRYRTDKSFREEVLRKAKIWREKNREKNPDKQAKIREKDNAQKRERYRNDKVFREYKRETTRKHHAENPEINIRSSKKRALEKPEEIKKWMTEYRLKNKVKLKKKRHQNYVDNKEKSNNQSNEWIKNNKERFLEWRRAYEKTPEVRAKINARYNKRVKEDAIFRIRRNLKVRIYEYIKDGKGRKYGTMKELLGCDWKFFKLYIENKFQPGMNWNNYGKWHIDHVVAISKFNLALKSEQFKSCHHTNLQPLWAIDNMKKGDKY